ncbi:hypothetical protein [Actinoplanes xinjiangensis]|nr:hypothetical protein [Actinoplanes xinjiangensis]
MRSSLLRAVQGGRGFGGNIIETGTDSYRLPHTRTATAENTIAKA